MLTRRASFLGLTGVLAMPAIARSHSLMRLSTLTTAMWLPSGGHAIQITVQCHDDGSFTIVRLEPPLGR